MFRLKIALLSILLSGAVLVGMGLYSLSVMNRVGMARIDREILTLGEGHLAIRPPRDYWQNFEKSLSFIYGKERSENLIVQVRDSQNEILFKSSLWPKEITENSFPDFDRTMDTNPSIPRKQDRHGPPPEAYRACEGMDRGSSSQFVDAQGETIEGICEKDNERLVLRPNANRDNRRDKVFNRPEKQLHSPPLESGKPERSIPKIKKIPYLATIKTSSGTWRIGIMGSDRFTIMVGVNMAGFYEDSTRYRMAFLSIIPIALILLAGGGWIIAQRALKPISMITGTAESITVRALNQRVPMIDGDKELSRLVEVINGMLDRLEKSFSQAIRFSANAAHELQTPLTILQGELDDAIQHSTMGSDVQLHYSNLLEEVQQLKSIVQKLLLLAHADAGRLDLHLKPTDLSALIESAAEDAGVIAPHLQIETEITPGVIVKADADLIGQAIGNLTSNAVKYNCENGLIRFQLSVQDNTSYITVSNTGIAIPLEDREKIFDRFYRIDQSHNRKVPGSGLGLNLALEIAHAHNGEICLNPHSDNLISFTLSLPCISC